MKKEKYRNSNGTFMKGYIPSSATIKKIKEKAKTNLIWGLRGKHHTQATKDKIRETITSNKKGMEERRRLCTTRCLGNSYTTDFLKKKSKIEREIWLKKTQTKQLISIKNYYKNHPEIIKQISERMKGNTIKHDFLIKHPIHSVPDWSKYQPFKSCPEYIDIPKNPLRISEQVSYFCTGNVGGLL